MDAFHSFGPAWQVASPQLSMHGSNILIDGESAFGCGLRGASMSNKPPSNSRWHILKSDTSDVSVIALAIGPCETSLSAPPQMPGTDLAAQVCYHPTPPQRVPDTISTPRPYEPNRSWKSKIPHNLENTNSIYPGRFAEAIAAANTC